MILPPRPLPLIAWDFKPIAGDTQQALPAYSVEPLQPPRKPALRQNRSTSVDHQKALYRQLLQATHTALPRVRDEAKQWAEALVFKLTGRKVDADTIFLNRFQQAQSANTVTDWEHLGEEPTVSQALPDALLSNFSEHDALPGVLDQQAGLYTVGRGQSTQGGYGAHNQFALAPSQLMHESWKTDFQAHMTQKLERFWRDHGDDYRTALKGEFIYQAREQLKAYERASPAERLNMPAEQRFTRDDYRLVMGAAANLPLDENQALSVEQLRATASVEDRTRVHVFDINWRPAHDILRFTATDYGSHGQLRDRRDGVQVLYMPGHKPAFLRFDSLDAMDQWVAEQGRHADTRKALQSHFALRDRQDSDLGFWSDFKSFITGDSRSNKGADSAIRYLASGYWDTLEGTVIDSANVRIHGDVFSVIKDATRERMSRDADVMIKSKSEVTRDTWLNDLTVAAGLAAKFAVIGEPVVVGVAAAAGLVEAEVGVEQSITGDTQAERKHGSTAALDGALNELFAIVGGTVKEPAFEQPATIPLTRELFSDGRQAMVIEHPLSPSAYTLPRANGYDLVDRGRVYRYLNTRPGELTDLQAAEHAKPLEGFEALCPAPAASGRVRRGIQDECFVKLIADLPKPQERLQALEHVRLFPSKAGLFTRERTVVYEKRLHTIVKGDTGPQLVPVANGERITYKAHVHGQLIDDPDFGFYTGDSAGTLANDTRVVKLGSITNASNDQRQLRGVVVTSASQRYLVVEADTAEFYYAPLDKTQTRDIRFKKCGPLEMSLAQGYRQFLSTNHAVQALKADFVALAPLKKAFKQLQRSGFSKADIDELKRHCKGMNPEQQREVVYRLQQANAIVKPDVALRPHRVSPLPGNQVHPAANLARADAARLTLGWLRRTAKLKAANAVQVAMGEATTLTSGNDVLSTRSLTDCSAIAVLTDWDGARYQTRTLMHLTGSNLELGLRGGNTQALLDRLNASLNKGGRVILVGGVNSDSLQGMATTIGQSLQGEQPLRTLLQARPGVSVTLASSLGITLNADGTFELIEGTGKGVMPEDQVREIFNRVD
ncbi:dermonecrotic toxin domain-containing protein [Pseudomonas lactis]|uniref:dermonecrotic toxin domain-containing protein n=1 Tax=Pseudomonas lactis TaxID=1615674 RepID=UPI003F7D5526